MEKAVFPLTYMNITQGVNGSFTHLGSKAIDLGNTGQKELVYAPFDGVIKKVYKTSGNFVWFESKEKVLWADGTEDYMTVLTGHDDNVESLYVGREFKQGEVYYAQGSSGNTTNVHVHLEVGRGTFSGNGWNKNEFGVWVISNSVHPASAFFVKETTVIDNDAGYPWKILKVITDMDDIEESLSQNIGENRSSVSMNDSEGIDIEDIDNTGTFSKEEPEKIFTCGRDGTYYLKLYKGETLYIGNVNKI